MARSQDLSQEEMISLVVTRNEAIAIGETIFAYYSHLRAQEKLTSEQQFLAEHLANFYNRLVPRMTRSQ